MAGRDIVSDSMSVFYTLFLFPSYVFLLFGTIFLFFVVLNIRRGNHYVQLCSRRNILVSYATMELRKDIRCGLQKGAFQKGDPGLYREKNDSGI